jgi:hypothetical protein
MKYQKGRGNVVSIYRCPRHSVHGTCEAPSSISADRLEEYVLAQFLARASDVNGAHQLENDDGAAAVEAALEAERTYKAWLTNTAMQQALGADYDARLLALKGAWDDARAAIPSPSSNLVGASTLAEHVAEIREAGEIAALRELLSTGIQAVFVRPAASRAKNLPIEDRVRIVWMDEEPVDVPHRGGAWTPRPFTWSQG